MRGGEERERKRDGSQIKIAWSKSRFGDLEFLRVRGEHEAGGGRDNDENVENE